MSKHDSTKHSRRPSLACEIAADRVLAGRAADTGADGGDVGGA